MLMVLATDFGDGGVERMLVNTANALDERGVAVTFLTRDTDARFVDQLRAPVRRCELRGERLHEEVAKVLRRVRPRVLLSAKLGDDQLAARARALADVPARLVFRVGNPLLARLDARSLNPLWRWWKTRSIRKLYAQADECVAVSRGIADELVRGVGVDAARVHVLPNPTVTRDVYERALLDSPHPWLDDGGAPVILAVGGLRRQKNFALLIRAFARVRAQRACRLLILGEGRQRARLLALCQTLGVAQDVALPGWHGNPYAFMSRAAVFALTSLWEGSPNVLVEAAALGVPLVATDGFGGGARDILRDGRYGELVPNNDEPALVRALLHSLDAPRPAAETRMAAAPYTARASALAYMHALRLEGLALRGAPL